MSADFKQGVNLAGRILASGQVAPASTDTTVYTVPASSAAKIATFVLTNVANAVTSGATTVVSVSVIPSSGTQDGTHVVLSQYPLAPGDSLKLSEVEGAFLEAGAVISVNSSVAAALNYLITGAVSS